MKLFDKDIPGFVCQEYNLSKNANRGGIGVEDFFSSIIAYQSIRGVVLVYDHYAQALTVKKMIVSDNKALFRKWLFLAMTRYAMGIFGLHPNTEMKLLLQDYELTGKEELLSGEKYKDVIGERLSIPDDFLDGEKVFILVHHDGSPLYLMRRHGSSISGK